MKIILQAFIYFICTLAALTLTALALAWFVMSLLLAEAPAITDFETTSLNDIKRIKSLALDFSRQSDLSKNKTLLLSERDINLGIGHFAPLQVDMPPNSFLKVELAESRQAIIFATLPASTLWEEVHRQYQKGIPALLSPVVRWLRSHAEKKWINLRWDLIIEPGKDPEKWIQTNTLAIGDIDLSSTLSRKLADAIYQKAIQRPDTAMARESWKNLRNLKISNHQLMVEFVLPTQGASVLNSYQSLMLSANEQQLIEIYHQKIQTLPSRGPLVSIMAELFKLAKRRSNETLDPIAENRGALLALSKKYGGDQLINILQSRSGNALTTAPKPYTIFARQDLAQHLVLSAGLSLVANQNLAELIGIDKELSDLMGGRAISAWDLMADKAGVRLAENATASVKSAQKIQRWFSKARRDHHLLPDLGQEFTYSEDRFNAEDLVELELMIELYMEQHGALQKQM